MSSSVDSSISLFVGDLSIFCTEDLLRSAFEPHGTIVDVKIIHCENTNKNLCYGFVKFASQTEGAKAMAVLNGMLLCGRPLRIRWAAHRPGGNEHFPAEQSKPTASVHITYASSNTAEVITEDLLLGVFQTFGDVQDIIVKKYEIDHYHGWQRGYGFVHYSADEEGIASAMACVQALPDTDLDGVHFKCSVSHKLQALLNTTHGTSFEQPAGHQQVPWMYPVHAPSPSTSMLQQQQQGFFPVFGMPLPMSMGMNMAAMGCWPGMNMSSMTAMQGMYAPQPQAFFFHPALAASCYGTLPYELGTEDSHSHSMSHSTQSQSVDSIYNETSRDSPTMTPPSPYDDAKNMIRLPASQQQVQTTQPQAPYRTALEMMMSQCEQEHDHGSDRDDHCLSASKDGSSREQFRVLPLTAGPALPLPSPGQNKHARRRKPSRPSPSSSSAATAAGKTRPQ